MHGSRLAAGLTSLLVAGTLQLAPQAAASAQEVPAAATTAAATTSAALPEPASAASPAPAAAGETTAAPEPTTSPGPARSEPASGQLTPTELTQAEPTPTQPVTEVPAEPAPAPAATSGPPSTDAPAAPTTPATAVSPLAAVTAEVDFTIADDPLLSPLPGQPVVVNGDAGMSCAGQAYALTWDYSDDAGDKQLAPAGTGTLDGQGRFRTSPVVPADAGAAYYETYLVAAVPGCGVTGRDFIGVGYTGVPQVEVAPAHGVRGGTLTVTVTECFGRVRSEPVRSYPDARPTGVELVEQSKVGSTWNATLTVPTTLPGDDVLTPGAYVTLGTSLICGQGLGSTPVTVLVAPPGSAPSTGPLVTLPRGPALRAVPGQVLEVSTDAGAACAGQPYSLSLRYRAARPGGGEDSRDVTLGTGTVGPDGVLTLALTVPADALRTATHGSGMPGTVDEYFRTAFATVRIEGCATTWEAASIRVLESNQDQTTEVEQQVVPRGQPVRVLARNCLGGAEGTLSAPGAFGRLTPVARLVQESYADGVWVGTAVVGPGYPSARPGPAGTGLTDLVADVRCGQSTGRTTAALTDLVPVSTAALVLSGPGTGRPGLVVTATGAYAQPDCQRLEGRTEITYLAADGPQSAGGPASVGSAGDVTVGWRIPDDAVPGPARIVVSAPSCGYGVLDLTIVSLLSTTQRTSVSSPTVTAGAPGAPAEVVLEAAGCFGDVSYAVRTEVGGAYSPAAVRDAEQADGRASAVVEVPGRAGDAAVFRVTCAASTGQTDVLVRVEAQGADAVVAFVATTTTVREDADSVQVVLVRDDAEPRSVTVRVGTVDGTATAGQDYQRVERDVTFPTGSSRVTVSVPILQDGRTEGSEAFSVQVLDSPVDVFVAEGASQVTITDVPPVVSPPIEVRPIVDPVAPPATPPPAPSPARTPPATPSPGGPAPSSPSVAPSASPAPEGDLPFADEPAPGVSGPTVTTGAATPGAAPTAAGPGDTDGSTLWTLVLVVGLLGVAGGAVALTRRTG